MRISDFHKIFKEGPDSKKIKKSLRGWLGCISFSRMPIKMCCALKRTPDKHWAAASLSSLPVTPQSRALCREVQQAQRVHALTVPQGGAARDLGLDCRQEIRTCESSVPVFTGQITLGTKGRTFLTSSQPPSEGCRITDHRSRREGSRESRGTKVRNKKG